jgi:uncharacterized repeat protein (TIGR01451 family)
MNIIPILISASMALAGWTATAAQPGTPREFEERVERTRLAMERASGGSVNVVRSRLHGLATHVSADRSRPIPVNAPASASPEIRARAYLSVHGAALGLKDGEAVRARRLHPRDEAGMEHARFEQVHRGVPVTAGEVMVHLRGAGVVSVNARTLPNLDEEETNPTLRPAEAMEIVRAVLAKHLGVADAQLSEPRLEIFNRGLLDGARHPTRLAWFIEARRSDLRRFLWVDAHSGAVLLHFSQMAHALNRRVHDAQSNSGVPGTLVRSEGGPPATNPEANAAYDLSGVVYNYFLTEHGRDSYDNAGATIVSTVDYCPATTNCPLANAYWNGSQMLFGDGYVHDDVVGHELTHAVTEYSANLLYFLQSGALNESYSDIFGETIDLLTAGGNEAASARWLIGEDIPGGAIRSMMDPTRYRNPGKVSDSFLVCNPTGYGADGDWGGVHSNSGVPNHAYALMADGGSYNGYSITGIGLAKAAKIQYRALTTYLLSGSDFADNYHALKQACRDLIGLHGITAADCAEVDKALEAVEMALPWPCLPDPPVTPPPCSPTQMITNLVFDDFEAGPGSWSLDSAGWRRTNTFSVSSRWHLHGLDRPMTGDTSASLGTNVAIPGPGTFLQFSHAWGFESDATRNYDGGVIEYTTNNGATWLDAGGFIVAGPAYNGLIQSGLGNPLDGRNGFIGKSLEYLTTRLDLSGLAGRQVRFRFRIGTDVGISDYGWFIDDVQFLRCVEPAIVASGAVIEAEGCAPANGAVDPGETVTLSFGLRNTGSTDLTSVTATLLTGGGIASPTGPQLYGTLGTGAGPVLRPFTFEAAGVCGETLHAILRVQSGDMDLGTVSFPISLGRVTTNSTTWTSTNRLVIPHGEGVELTASAIPVSGVGGAVSKAVVTLSGLSHGYSSDLDVVLQAPGGQTVVLLSDVGGSTSATNVTLTFDDAASTLPLASALRSGRYQPTDVAFDTFPFPLPDGPHGRKLAAVSGANPNGVWKLFVMDDGGSGGSRPAGTLAGGWSLTLFSSNTTCCAGDDLSISATEAQDPVGVGDAVEYSLAVTNSGPGAAGNVSVVFTIPPGLANVSALPAQGSCSVVGDTIQCGLGALPGGSAAMIAIRGTAASPGTLAGAATVTSELVEPSLANNSMEILTAVHEPVAVSINDLTVTERDSTNLVRAVLSVVLNRPASEIVTVNFGTADGSARTAGDFLSTNGTLAFLPGELVHAIRVPIVSDAISEPAESFLVNLSDPINALLGARSQGLVTVEDNDPLVLVTEATVTEGNVGITNLVFLVTTTNLYEKTVRITFATSNLTAEAGADFASANGTITLSPGQPSSNIVVVVGGDVMIEDNEALRLVLSSPTNASVATNVVLGTILNDDGLPGQIDHCIWSPLAPTQYVDLSFGGALTALDGAGQPVDSFAGPVSLAAMGPSQETTVGTNSAGSWVYPFQAGTHDARLQFILLAGEVGGAGRISGLSLDVTTVPGLTLSNWTIRLKHTAQTNYPVNAWEGIGWTFAYQTNLSLTSTGWVAFPFSTPFDYDGSNHLMVDLSFNNAATGVAGQCRYRNVTAPARCLYAQVNGTFGDPLAWSGTNAPVPTVTLRLPNLRLTTQPLATLFPPASGAFAEGMWSGELLVPQAATSLVLRAVDGQGHQGVSGAFAVVPAPDLDGDALPDPWEVRYFGLTDHPNGTPDSDADQDGASNRAEHRAGTDPTNAASRLQLTAELSGADVWLRFTAQVGRSYRLERAASLGETAAWEPVPEAANLTGSGAVVRVIGRGAATQPQQFYRIVIP